MFCNVGDVVRFRYKDDESPRMAKILAVRDTATQPLLHKSIVQYHTDRNRYLITAKQTDGRVKSFYTDNIQSDFHRLTIAERLKAWLAGARF